ncbi:MAG: transposase [Saprospiraceae bacterium]
MKKDYWHPFVEGCIYHIYNRSNNKEPIFLSDENYLFFLRQWDKYLSPYLETYSYALIPNHFHFAARVKQVDKFFQKAVAKEKTVASKAFAAGQISLDVFLEDQMKRFLSSYAKAFNKQNDRNGSVFQKRFKRVVAKTESHVVYLVTYHHHNPIHHRLTTNYEDWRYTSYRAMLSNAPTKICREKVLGLFHSSDMAKARQEFLAYHKAFKYDKRMEYLMLED